MLSITQTTPTRQVKFNWEETMKKNVDVRNLIEQAGVKYWEVAEALRITDGNFSRKLRKELPTKEKELITNIVWELKNKKEGEGKDGK